MSSVLKELTVSERERCEKVRLILGFSWVIKNDVIKDSDEINLYLQKII